MMNETNNTACTLALAFVASTLSTFAAHAADVQQEPLAILASLSDRIYVLGETTGNATDMIAAEAKAAEEIRKYIASGATSGLLATGKGKLSPLATAAYMGYPNIVAALVTSEVVRSHINDAGEMEMTPWIASTLSMKQSAWACNPEIFENPYAFVPMLVSQTYYLSNPIPPYRKTREVLERAGATPDMAKAKQVWTSVCKNQSAEGKTHLQSSTDLQQTVQKLGMSALEAQLRALQEKTHGEQKK